MVKLTDEQGDRLDAMVKEMQPEMKGYALYVFGENESATRLHCSTEHLLKLHMLAGEQLESVLQEKESKYELLSRLQKDIRSAKRTESYILQILCMAVIAGIVLSVLF